MAAATNLSPSKIFIGWLDCSKRKRFAYIWKMPSQQSFGSIDSKPIMYWYFIKTSLAILPQVQNWIKMFLYYVSKPSFNWMLSGTLATLSSELMQHIILLNIKISSSLRLLLGTIGAMVSNYLIRDFGVRRLSLKIGVPITWMLSSNVITNTIAFFVNWVKEASPGVQPSVIMTDCDQAQIAALQIVCPQSQILLCTWHVLRMMRSHFVTDQFEALWDKIEAWVNTNDLSKFLTLWDEISSDPSVPQSVVWYLTTEWMQVPHMWLKVAQKNRSIFEEGDTNMLIEAYVYTTLCCDKITDLIYLDTTTFWNHTGWTASGISASIVSSTC